MSSVDQDHTVKSSTQLDPQQQSHLSSDNDENVSKASWLSWNTGGLILAAIIILVYSMVDFTTTTALPDPELAPLTTFDSRMLSCNDVSTAQPSPAYDTCLSAAQDGQALAIKRLIWAYSRKGDYQDLGKVFDWLRALPYKDNATQLLMFSLVHLNTKTDQLRKDSELGITRLVAKNYPPANVVLASIYALDENTIAPTSNTIWLLNKTNKKNPFLVDASMLAIIHANGLVSDVNIPAAADVLKKAASSDFPMTTNNIAWFLATLDDNPFAPSDYAVSLANSVVDDPEHGQNPIYVDTLAATFAANDMFEKAIETQSLALQLLKTSNVSEAELSKTQEEYEQRLQLYSQNKALIERTLAVDKAVFFKRIRNRVLEYVLHDFFIPIEAPDFYVAEAVEVNAPVKELAQ